MVICSVGVLICGFEPSMPLRSADCHSPILTDAANNTGLATIVYMNESAPTVGISVHYTPPELD